MSRDIEISAGGDMQVYRARSKDGWDGGTICIREWERGEGDRHNFCGEILINSTYGVYAYTWTAMATRLKRFLVSAARAGERSYIMEKLSGYKTTEFCPDATRRGALESILEHRRGGDIDKSEAREAFDAVNEAPDFETEMIEAFSEIRMFRDSYYDMSRTRIRPQVAGFWSEIFIPFAEHLAKELETVPA